jgi:uncharacterized protein YggE
VGIESVGNELKLVREENAKRVKEIIRELESLKLSEMIIQSPKYKISLLKENPNVIQKELRTPKIIGYQIIQGLIILIKNDSINELSENSSQIIDVCINTGVNIIDKGAVFFKDDVTQDKEKALELATMDAISKAKIIAQAADVSIEDYSMIRSSFSSRSSYRHAYNNSFMHKTETSNTDDTPTTLLAGEIPVTANINLICLIKKVEN